MWISEPVCLYLPVIVLYNHTLLNHVPWFEGRFGIDPMGRNHLTHEAVRAPQRGPCGPVAPWPCGTGLSNGISKLLNSWGAMKMKTGV